MNQIVWMVAMITTAGLIVALGLGHVLTDEEIATLAGGWVGHLLTVLSPLVPTLPKGAP